MPSSDAVSGDTAWAASAAPGASAIVPSASSGERSTDSSCGGDERALESRSVSVSSPSAAVSASNGTSTVFSVSPGAKVSVSPTAL